MALVVLPLSEENIPSGLIDYALPERKMKPL